MKLNSKNIIFLLSLCVFLLLFSGCSRKQGTSVLDIAKLYLDEYALMEKIPAEYPTGSFVLSQAGTDRIEEILINAGYPVIDEQAGYPPYLANPDGLHEFWEKVQSGEAATQTVLHVNRSGGFSQIMFHYLDGVGSYSRTDVALDEKNKPYIMQIENHNIFNWDITPRNVFYYQIYPGGDKHYPDYNTIRLDPPDKLRWDMTVKYVYPICYQAVNVFLCDWSESDYSAVHFNDLFEYLYCGQNGELFNPEEFTYSNKYDGYSIPADLFEKTILPYFTISLEDFRKLAMYDADTNTYPWRPFYTNDVIWYPAIEPEVISYTDNGNGTMTLHIEVSSTDVKTDCLFAHHLTVRLLDDGKFQYVGNKITYQTEEYGLPPAGSRLTSVHP